IIEISLLIKLSELNGGVATIALYIVNAIFGAKLVMQPGVGAMGEALVQMAPGQMPA
ncbi:F exclusion suppressor, partial [Pseudoalteromonas ruthenica]